MQVSVETTKGLERKVKVQVPAEQFEGEVNSRLKDLANKVKLDGFRPGKVPFHVVKQRYTPSVEAEVMHDLMQKTLFEALQENKLNPAGQPFVEPEKYEAGKDFNYTATLEVYPEITPVELEKDEVEQVNAQVNDSDLEEMLDKLREQHKTWNEVQRKTQKGDKISLDFKGFVNDEEFEGGEAKDFELELGSGSMIPGFEDGLLDVECGKEFDLNVTFPEDYGQQDLAGKPAVFKCTVNKVMEGVLPELDDEFAEKFNVKEGGIEALRAEIRQNMERELERQVKSVNKEKLFDKLLEKNTFEVPNALIDREIQHLKEEMYQRVFGNQKVDKSKLPELPREMFEEQARRRVHLGLLIAEYVSKHELKPNEERVVETIEKLAESYERPEELKQWYMTNDQRKAEIEAIVLEEQVADKIKDDATIVEKDMDYQSIMNPSKDDSDKE
jgi:trigger factor